MDSFLPEREDWRTAAIVNMIHNVNVTKDSYLTKTVDWMPKSLEERLEEEEVRARQEEELNNDDNSTTDNWNEFVTRLKASGKPVQSTFKG